MLLLGIDIGTSFIKISVIDAATGQCLNTASYPESEAIILSEKTGWAEQSADLWWEYVKRAIIRSHSTLLYDPFQIKAIGIAYQMHGLVMVDSNQNTLRNSIIWCDSRAIDIGKRAFNEIGEEKCLTHLLNSPANFTASKLAWVKKNEPELFKKVTHILLPGDFIAMKLTGEVSTTVSALSEGMFWDFEQNDLSDDILSYFNFDRAILPEVKEVFSIHGYLTSQIAQSLSLAPGIPVSYKAGDQLNNALSLNVLEPGEMAASAGTSGVIYGVTDKPIYDKTSRINSFAHVNHSSSHKRLGILLCINGTGILNRWVKNLTGENLSYEEMNAEASGITIGSEGLQFFPFGNGAERILDNRNIHAQLSGIDLNTHSRAHVFRAAQEGIAYAFRYGVDIMREAGMHPLTIRVGLANMFRSPVFLKSFANTLNVPVEVYFSDGSIGAAIGAGIGARIYKNEKEAFSNIKLIHKEEPLQAVFYDDLYQSWKYKLNQLLCQQ